ncbi:MAG: hypothetical protein IKM45_02150 [Opitutales bacterium]|nr:hypothetical protein [Opitutales bacterium]
MNNFFPAKRFLARALVFAFAAGTLYAEETTEKKKIAGELQGYFVRVKSGVSGEKELYYNKDGTLRSSSNDGLLSGDFSLDQSLLGEGDLELSFEPVTFPQDASSSPKTGTPAKSADRVPAIKKPEQPPAHPPNTDDEESGTVDADATLKKFSREKKDFGINPDTFKKVVNSTVNDRFNGAVSLREWQGRSTYGMSRFSELDKNYEMRTAALDKDAPDFGLFETRSSIAGEKMFVRTDNGLLEVKLNSRFSSVQNMRAAERPIALRESSGFSMQDINRYQFRRNRSSDPGLSVVSPGGKGEVRKETFSGGNAPQIGK